MPGIMVPKSKAEAPRAGGESLFPEGEFVGTIEKVEVKSLPFTPSEGQGYVNPSQVEITSLWLGDNAPAEAGGTSPGARKYFVDFVTRDGDIEISAGPEISEAAWQMQRSAAMLANLAHALGATEEVEFEGETYVTTTDGFLEQLQAGELNGSRVGFVTFHRAWKSKAGKSGTAVELREFFQAV